MKYLGLVWSNLRRRKTRSLLTVACIAMAFLVFGLAAAVAKAFLAGADVAGADRLVTSHKVSLIQPLPVAYGGRIRAVEGVADVTHATWMGGYYQDKRRVIPTFPVDAESYLRVYPELRMPEAQRRAFLQDRTGMMVGRVLAEQYGWKPGDRVPIRSSIYRRQDGSDTWDLTVRAVYYAEDDEGDQSSVFLHNDYFNETLPESGRDFVGWYVVQIADPERAPQIASAVDERFANSRAETKTATEAAFAQSFAQQIGDIGTIVTAVTGAAFFTMLLVIANTMGQSVRERTAELAVLKTLGFTNTTVTLLVLAEALFITVLGGMTGLGLALLLIAVFGDAVRQVLAVFYLPQRDIALALALMVAFGLAAGALPATQALRLRIADALRRS